MEKEASSITNELQSRGIETKFSIPEEVNMVGVFQEYVVLEYIPEEGTDKNEIVATMKKLSEAYDKEVLDKVCKIYADFCEEYGVKISTERAVSAVKGKDILRRDEAMMGMSLELFT